MITANRTAQIAVDQKSAVEAQGCVRLHIGKQRQPSPILAILLSRIQLSHWYRGTRGILREIRNLCHRILRLRQIQWGQQGVKMDQDHLQLRHLPREALIASTRARMSGIEDLYSNRPYSTLLDAEVFLLGWVRAEAFLRGTSGIPSNMLNDKPPSGPPSGVS
jgi:hypothetical protein